MSSSLKDRLKRCGRYHASPIAVRQMSVREQNKSCTQSKIVVDSSITDISLSCSPVLLSSESIHGLHLDEVIDKIEVSDVGRKVAPSKIASASIDNNHDIDLEMVNADLSDNTADNDSANDSDKPLKDYDTPTWTRQRKDCGTRGSLKEIRRNRLEFANDNAGTEGTICDESKHSRAPEEVNSVVASSDQPGCKTGCSTEEANKNSYDGWSYNMLDKEIAKKKELLRKLKMVKMYRTKVNSLSGKYYFYKCCKRCFG